MMRPTRSRHDHSPRRRAARLLVAGVVLLSSACGIERAPRDAEPAAARQADRLPDFASLRDTRERKRTFFEFLYPIVQAENDTVRARRSRLLDLHRRHRYGFSFTTRDSTWLRDLAARYRVRDPDLSSGHTWSTLKKRVDVIPARLVLVQAAHESAWGTSRFAREGNALFGQWCYLEACGMVPRARAAGATHEVARFETVNAAVRSYLHNLNTHPAYRALRQLRHEERLVGREPRARLLATGLGKYSQRGDEYLAEILKMLRVNGRLMDIAARRAASPGPDASQAAATPQELSSREGAGP